MRTNWWLWCGALVAVGNAGCLVDGHFTAEQWELIQTLGPRPELPEDPTNRVADDARAAELGHLLFFDERLAAVDPGEGGFACVHCHALGRPVEGIEDFDPATAYADHAGTPTSHGLGWTPRNTPTVVDSAYNEWFMWDGRADSQWMAVTYAAEVGAAQNATRVGIAHLLYDEPDYNERYGNLFGSFPQALIDDAWPLEGKPKPSPSSPDGAWEGMDATQQDEANEVYANFAKSLAAYLRKLECSESDFDRYLSGDDDAISEAAKRGLALFVGKAGCVECHSGPMLTDGEFHNLGVSQVGEHLKFPDDGRHEGIEKLKENDFNADGDYSDAQTSEHLDDLVAVEGDRGAFRTPGLRNVSRNAPYMHTGQLLDLRSVVEFYRWGGAPSQDYPGQQDAAIEPLDLSDGDVDDLVAFLLSLQGGDPPAEWTQDPGEP